MFTFSIAILSLFVTFSNTLNVSPYSTYQFHRETNRNTLLQIPSEHFPFVDLLPNQINSRTILNGIHIIQKLKPKTARHVQKYLFLLLLANASDTETNPGPKTPRWPCGLCNKAVTWKHKADCCDTCETWFHIDCQGIPNHIYNIMNNSNISWHCIQCGMPNFTTSFFNSTTIETSNLFDSLNNNTSFGCIGSPGAPTAAS